MENVIEKGGQPMKLPVEFTDRMKKLLGDEYNDFEYCYDNDNYQGLRINSLKVGEEDYKRIRAMFGCETSVEWEENGFYYDYKNQRVFKCKTTSIQRIHSKEKSSQVDEFRFSRFVKEVRKKSVG